MVAPSGEQHEINGGGYRAVVTECGATLRVLEYDGRPLVQGFAEDGQASSGRGQLLAPWPNRIADGAYSFDGRDLQLPLSEPSRGNASHGLVRWAAWTMAERTDASVTTTLRLMHQTGYPWTLDLRVHHEVSADGLTVTFTARNRSGRPAPYALGAHPFLVAGPGTVDDWELTLPGATRLLVDDRMIPTERSDVADTEQDFRVARRIGSNVLDTAFTDLAPDASGRTTVTLRHPATGQGTELWMDQQHHWLQVFTGDPLPERAREALAVEPMTAPPNAFRTGEDVVTLAGAGNRGDEHTATWGIRAL